MITAQEGLIRARVEEKTAGDSMHMVSVAQRGIVNFEKEAPVVCIDSRKYTPYV